MDWLDVLQKADAPLVLLVMGGMLKWALSRIEEKDKIIVDIATRSSKAVEAALERKSS